MTQEETSSISESTTDKKLGGFKGLLSEIMKIVQVRNPDEIMPRLKEMEEKANRKLEPVFVERVKEKEVPVIVEKVKEVEKEVEVEKIVIQEKIVEVPVFKEKIVERFIDKPKEASSYK